MTLDEYQQFAQRTMMEFPSNDQAMAYLALGLLGETGEVGEIVKKYVYHGHVVDIPKLNKEIGDVLWYVACLAGAIGMSLGDIADINIAKLMVRYPDGWSPNASVNRKE